MGDNTMNNLLDAASDVLWELRGALEEKQSPGDDDEVRQMHEQTMRALSLIIQAKKISSQKTSDQS